MSALTARAVRWGFGGGWQAVVYRVGRRQWFCLHHHRWDYVAQRCADRKLAALLDEDVDE